MAELKIIGLLLLLLAGLPALLSPAPGNRGSGVRFSL